MTRNDLERAKKEGRIAAERGVAGMAYFYAERARVIGQALLDEDMRNFKNELSRILPHGQDKNGGAR